MARDERRDEGRVDGRERRGPGEAVRDLGARRFSDEGLFVRRRHVEVREWREASEKDDEASFRRGGSRGPGLRGGRRA